jgi:hypothetical protein
MNLFEVAFVQRGARGAPAVPAYSRRFGLTHDAACERLISAEFSSVVSTELKSVVWTDFRKIEEV